MHSNNHSKQRAIDVQGAQKAVRDLIDHLGFDSSEERLLETPRRVVESLIEMTSHRAFEAVHFKNVTGHIEPILLKGIGFVSVCEHHLLPFRGRAHVGYVPGDEIVGLSTIPFAVEKFAKTLTLQEPLTDKIADYLVSDLRASSAAVMLIADHDCMQVRGVKASNATTITHAFRGNKASDDAFRNWFFSLTGEIENG